MYQSTLKSEVSFKGIGIHSGDRCCISVSPASKDAGIVILKGKDSIDATYDNVFITTLSTRLIGTHGSCIATVEHLLAALYGLRITNAIITTESDEIPILDGSACQFVSAFLSTGIMIQQKKFRTLRVLKPVKVQDGEKWTSLSPSDSFSINIECDFNTKGLGTSPYSFDFSNNDFVNEIAPARTFGFLSDVEFLRKNNLALGASLENTIVFDDNGQLLNKTGFRVFQEPVRHKVLDVIGDLSLAKCAIRARFDSFCPSHKMNNMILRALFEKADNYEITE
ncbi:MAG: UDP-3-O-acyl-N-acetylglucosamine deacetylase [Holosporaceae bacterium]|nr:UDP-3-O-acyl-N-acetylglucosamine deacetylase [Holosporaceae bacterium]